MTCDDCAAHVTKALGSAGLEKISVSWRDGRATFLWPSNVPEDQFRSSVATSGYGTGKLTILEDNAISVTSDDFDYDLIIIGGGSAAFSAAIKATEANFRVAIIEKGEIGGTCVNVGCVPSKALLKAGELAWSVNHHPFNGLTTSSKTVDLENIVRQKNDLVTDLRQHKYIDLIGEYGFTLLHGHAQFVDESTIEVDGTRLSAQRFIIATGGSPSTPPIPGLAESGYLNSTDALNLNYVPARIAVIGANSIGLELGQFFLHVGSNITFIDAANSLAPFNEPEASQAISEVLLEQGATIYTQATVSSVSSTSQSKELIIQQNGIETALIVDEIIVATGRRPNTRGMGLELAGVTLREGGSIQVDEHLQTSNEKIYAAGDVTGGPQFVYVAAYEGALCVDNALLGKSRSVDFTGLPRVTFTSPQIASAGITEQQALSDGHEIKTSIIPLTAVPRALVNRDTKGMVKLVAEKSTGRLIGATIVAEGAGDVIQSAVLAIKYGISVEELAMTFHPYLTMAESIKLAAQTFDRDVSKLSCCAA